MYTMKNNIIIIAIFISLGLISGCEKLDVENPNGGINPGFATAQEGAAYIYTGEFARVSSMLTQQLQGNDIHYEPIYSKYILSDTKLTNSYNIAYFDGISLAMDKKTDEGHLVSALIYSVIMEYFDNAEKYIGRAINPEPLEYSYIHELAESVGGEFSIAAQMLNARVYLNESNYQGALDALPTAMSEDDGYFVVHSGSSTSLNEWPRFQSARGGYLTPDTSIYSLELKVAATFVNEDTRMPYPIPAEVDVIFGTDTISVASTQMDTFKLSGRMANDPRIDAYYGDGVMFGFPMTSNSAAYLIDYAEVKFIEAEAKLETNDPAGAQLAFTAAVTASFAKVGVDGTAFMASHGTLDATKAIAKEQIMTQKSIHMFGHPMVFVDYKRTQLPKIVEKNSNFPDKWHYYYQ